MEEIELWKIIDVCENYEVSSFGNIRNYKTGRILKQAKKGGYCSVGLSNKNTKSYSVHQLVAKAFIPNPQNKLQVNHLDKNGFNNNFKNLEWVTNKENSIHRSKNIKQTTNQNIEIYRINIDTDEILENYESIEDGAKWVVEQKLSDKFHSARTCISCCVKNLTKSSYGFKWKKIEQNDLDNEEWREIVINNIKTPGYYVSSLGRFKNKKGIIMKDYKPHHSGYVYLRVNVQKYALHRLVAQTFIQNFENKPFVNHIDGNKINNCINNLEWVTCAENNLHNHKTYLINCFTRKVGQYDLEMNEINKFDSIKQASDYLKISSSSIKSVLYKKQKTAKGYIWKYLD
jgi:hypothetical protein